MAKKDWIDPLYEPKMTQVRKKPVCMVRIDPTSTVKKLSRKYQHICSKGELECRISNNRLTNQLNRLSALSPRIDENLINIRMHNNEAP